VYGLTCRIDRPEAIQRVYALKKMDPKKPLAILVLRYGDRRALSRAGLDPAYRVMKRVLPGPYTFIFEASRRSEDHAPQAAHDRIRMPDHPVTRIAPRRLDQPLLSSSIRNPDDDFVNDPLRSTPPTATASTS